MISKFLQQHEYIFLITDFKLSDFRSQMTDSKYPVSSGMDLLLHIRWFRRIRKLRLDATEARSREPEKHSATTHFSGKPSAAPSLCHLVYGGPDTISPTPASHKDTHSVHCAYLSSLWLIRPFLSLGHPQSVFCLAGYKAKPTYKWI